MVTRRYYRSGESEYYINRQAARLRDINELFMDTGLGREGYSNIGQGYIDEILSARSTDRREVFEEAAGISKYRHRKEETERRLASTEDNLLRIGDKITELELQVGPLREQAEKAEQYQKLRGSCAGWRWPSGWTAWKSTPQPQRKPRRTIARPPSFWSRSTRISRAFIGPRRSWAGSSARRTRRSNPAGTASPRSRTKCAAARAS